MINVSEDIHPDWRETVVGLIEGLCVDYPMVVDITVKLYQFDGEDKSMGTVVGSDTIQLNRYWFAQPRELFDKAVAEGRHTQVEGLPRWHGGMGEPNHVIIHEFMHLLMDALGEPAKLFAIDGCIRARANPEIAATSYCFGSGNLDVVDSVDLPDNWGPDEWFADTGTALRMGVSGSIQVSEMALFLTNAIRNWRLDQAINLLHVNRN